MKHIMLDLATLGTNSKSVIVAIGAVAFDFESDFQETWYSTVPDTVSWWSQQSDQAREIFKNPSNDLKSALNLFSAWVKEVDPVGVWGNGVDFDNVIIMNSYVACGMKMPYRYSKKSLLQDSTRLVSDRGSCTTRYSSQCIG